jgi:hypothetical protein
LDRTTPLAFWRFAMICGECESDRGIPFALFRKDATTERRVFCEKCVKTFRRAHRTQIRKRELVINVHFNSSDFKSVMHEFSGRPLRRRGRL